MRNTSPHSRIARLFAAGAAAIALVGSSIASPAPAYAATTTCAQERAAAQKELTAAQNEASKANSALKAAQTEKTAADSALKTAKASETQAKNNLAAAKKKLATAEANFASVKAEKAKIDKVNSQANSSAGVINDIILPGQIPFYVQANGNTGKPANSTLVAVKGRWNEGTQTKQKEAIDYINQIRREAANEGIVDKYVPVAWSKRLERAMQVRAVENVLFYHHGRPNPESWDGLDDEGLSTGMAENLSLDSSYRDAVNAFYEEKANYKKYLNCSKGKKTVNGVNQCDYGQYGHYMHLVNPSYRYVGIATFTADAGIDARGLTSPRSAAAMNLDYSDSSVSSDVKPTNVTVYQGVYVANSALSAINTSGEATYNPSAVRHFKPEYDTNYWWGASKVKEAKALSKSLASARWSTIQSNYNTKQAAVTAAQKEVNTAQAAVDKITAAQTRASKAATALTNAQTRVTKANQAVNTAQTKLAAAQKCLVSGITVSGSTSVNPGKTISLSAQINPTDAKNKAVTWSSSNTKIATVDAKGTVKGIAPGKVTITVTAKDGSKVKGTKTVQVVIPTDDVYRLYNTKSHEHLFTTSPHEKNVLSAMADWNYEGIAWKAPKSSKTPVYRLYNPTSGDHLYTTSSHEVTVLTTKHGWKKEGIAFYSDDYKTIPVYRQYNPALKTGSHHFTANLNEYNVNNTRGWKGEGIAWYAAAK